MGIASANIENCYDAGITRARDNFIAIGVILCTIDVGMGINEHLGSAGALARNCHCHRQ